MSADADRDAYWLAQNSREGSTLSGSTVSFYRQPGGCVEATISDGRDHDLFHFCEDDEARTFMAEFAQFLKDTADNQAKRDAERRD
jgi:hypothetical protein